MEIKTKTVKKCQRDWVCPICLRKIHRGESCVLVTKMPDYGWYENMHCHESCITVYQQHIKVQDELGHLIKPEDKQKDNNSWPAGYWVKKDVRCCANCGFGGFIGDPLAADSFCICEVNGECSNSDYASIAKHPLGFCDAFKWPHQIRTGEKLLGDDNDGE